MKDIANQLIFTATLKCFKYHAFSLAFVISIVSMRKKHKHTALQFDAFLTVHHSIDFFQITNLMHISFTLQQYVCYITILNMFRAVPCSSSGGQTVLLQHLVSSLSVNGRIIRRLIADCSPLSTGVLYGHLQRVMIPDVVIIQFELLKMSIVLLETCRGL